MTNCKQCGAPLHGHKCEYCGAEYSNMIPSYRLEVCNVQCDTISCITEVPLSYHMDEGLMTEMVKQDMARKMSEKLIKYMDVETWVKPETLSQVFGGRIRVVRPN